MNNVYNSEDVVPNTPTIVNAITVPARSGYSLKGVIVSSVADCDILIKLNVQTIAGGRVNGAAQTLSLHFEASPYGLGAGDIVTVIATSTENDSHIVHCTILVEQL